LPTPLGSLKCRKKKSQPERWKSADAANSKKKKFNLILPAIPLDLRKGFVIAFTTLPMI